MCNFHSMFGLVMCYSGCSWQNLSVCSWFPKQIDTQLSFASHHCMFLIGAPASYANAG